MDVTVVLQHSCGNAALVECIELAKEVVALKAALAAGLDSPQPLQQQQALQIPAVGEAAVNTGIRAVLRQLLVVGYCDPSLSRRTARYWRHRHIGWRLHLPHVHIIRHFHGVSIMAHFAQIDDNNTVVQVLVIDQSEINTGNWGDPAKWIKTSYNTRGGVYYTPNTDEPDPDQTKALHKNYAGLGDTWDGTGFAPSQPYASWIKDAFSYQWSPPVPMPPQPWPENVTGYQWNEGTLSWDPVTNQLR